jgi:hypothetical protein
VIGQFFLCPMGSYQVSGYLGLEFQIKGQTHCGWALDKDALSIMSEAWGEPANRHFELFEMIDTKPREELRASWAAFIFSGHYRTCTHFSESFLAIHPRRSFSTYSFDRLFADAGYINCTDMCPSRV